jgi:diguanylate cyclase (GGDEF)-like protein/PAS domain S-box-containing protein
MGNDRKRGSNNIEGYRAIFEYAPDPIIITDANGIVRLWNAQAEKLSGYKAEEMIGRPSQITVPDDLLEEAKWLAQEVREKGYIRGYETERSMKDGSKLPVELTMAVLRDDDGNFMGFTTIARDISERKRLGQEIKAKEFYHALSIIDELTELYNVRHFQEILTQELARAKRYSRSLSLLMIDIDEFKRYQDAHGHLVGDAALKDIAHTMKRGVIRGADIVARYGGEEFAILLPETAKNNAVIVAERLRQAVAETTLLGRERLTISIGVASYPEDAQDEKQLISYADQALYRAKQAGRNQVQAWE